MDLNTKFESAKRKLYSAFASMPYPGDDNLVLYADPESEEIARVFRGKHWTEISISPIYFLSKYRDGIFLFSPSAFRFYLPVWLLSCLHHYSDADVIPVNVVTALNKPADPREFELYKQRMSALTAEQVVAIRSALEVIFDLAANDGEPDCMLNGIRSAIGSVSEFEAS